MSFNLLSFTWLVKMENELALFRAETRTIRWMFGVKLTKGYQIKHLELQDIGIVLQHNR